MRYHDFHLREYTVSMSGSKIKLHLIYDYPNSKVRDSHIEFTEVICYHFCHTEGAIITNIDEEPLQEFVKKEEVFLISAGCKNGLRLWNGNITDYLRRLEEGRFHAWRIESAIGFSGFVVAKSVFEKEELN